MTETIKVLSIRQPWAWLIVCGYKNIENRTRKTDYRGRLYIHASQDFDWTALEWLEQFYEYQVLACRHFGIRGPRITMHKEEFGAIVGYADLTDCVQNSRSIWAQRGLFHWELHYPNHLAPVPLKGQLGIFEVKKEILQVKP